MTRPAGRPAVSPVQAAASVVQVTRAPGAVPSRRRAGTLHAARGAAPHAGGLSVQALVARQTSGAEAASSGGELTRALLQYQATAGNQAATAFVQRCGHGPCNRAGDAGWSGGEMTRTLLQLQATAGNQAVTAFVQRCGDGPCKCGRDEDMLVQGSWLGDAWDTASSAAGDAWDTASSAAGDVWDTASSAVGGADAARKALTLAEAALTDPGQIPALLVEMEWQSLPAPVKALVANRLLDACRALLVEIPAAIDPYLPPGLGLSAIVEHAATGFLDRAASYDDDKKVQVLDRFVELWAHPSADFTIGFLEGLLLGIWDGITGPFILIWDLVKLEWDVTQAEARFVAMLADGSKRKQFFADVEATWSGLEPKVADAVNQLLSSEADPMVFFGLLDKLMQALLAAAESAGGSLADALVAFMMEPDKELGKSIGRVEGNVLFQVLLIVLTAGGWAALSAAIEGIEWVADALEALQDADRAIEGFVAASEAFSRFSAFLRESKVLSELVDVMEDAFALFIRYLKFSYGIEGAEERAAGEIGSMTADQAVEAELARGARPEAGEGGHELFDTAEGCAVCSSPCHWLEDEYPELAAPGTEGDELREDLKRINGMTPNSEERMAAEKELQAKLEKIRSRGNPANVPGPGSGSDSPQTEAERVWEQARAQADEQERLADMPDTEHGTQRLGERGLSYERQQEIINNPFGGVREQDNGCEVFIGKDGQNSYSYVVLNENGQTVTALAGKSRQELIRLSIKYGWNPPFKP